MKQVPETSPESKSLTAAIALTTHSGPLPAPEQLEAYERAQPGTINVIIDIALSEQKHRHGLETGNLQAVNRHLDIEDKKISTSFKSSTWGQVLGFSVCLTSLGICAWLAMNGHDAAGIAVVSVSLAGIVRAFIGHKK
jgi:uncharacterized membrane protein